MTRTLLLVAFTAGATYTALQPFNLATPIALALLLGLVWLAGEL